MRIEDEIKLTFDDVLIRPKRSTLVSRSEVQLERKLKFKHTSSTWTGIPIVSANMDTTGTFEVYTELSKEGLITALHKHYSKEDLEEFVSRTEYNSEFAMYSTGISDSDIEKKIGRAHV